MFLTFEKRRKSADVELLKCRPPQDLATGLKAHEPIVYRQNGNRSRSVKAMLKQARLSATAVGITRVAEVSQLDLSRLPVFQVTRPNVINHVFFGQNSGSQGKGLAREQAMISAIMESIETYCLEVRNPDFICGSYSFLKEQYPILPPQSVFHTPVAKPALSAEKLLWTWAYHVDSGSPLLIPAETVFYPLMVGDYQVERHFMCGSNGLASGATYLEAVNHALYEVIERFYWAHMEIFAEKLVMQNVRIQEIKNLASHECIKSVLNSITLVSLRFREGENLPVFAALYSAGGQMTMGLGCAATLETAATRAVTEAIQGMTTKKSGAREDLSRSAHLHGKFIEKLWKRSPVIPKSDVISRAELAKHSTEKSHGTLKDEYDFLISWIKARGFNNICIANLTRTGIDVPVVKVIVPAMPPMFAARDLPASVHTTAEANRHLYRGGGEE